MDMGKNIHLHRNHCYIIEINHRGISEYIPLRKATKSEKHTRSQVKENVGLSLNEHYSKIQTHACTYYYSESGDRAASHEQS